MTANVCIVEYTNCFQQKSQKIVALIFIRLDQFMQDFKG